MRPSVKTLFLLCAALCGLSLFAAVAQACPMCNQSIADQDELPHAYMYSIIFMLAMPATVLSGIGTVIYLKFRQFDSAQPDLAASEGIAVADEVREVELARS